MGPRARPTCSRARAPRPPPPLPPGSSPQRRGFPGPRRAAHCWIPAAALVSTHWKNSWPAPPSPPSRRSPGSAPTSCRALRSRARAGVPGGRARSWPPRGRQWAGAAGSLGPFRERLSNSRPRHCPGQPRAPCVADPADGHRLVSVPRLSPCPSASAASGVSAQSHSEAPTLPGHPPSPLRGEDWGGRGRPGAALAPPRATLAARLSAGGSFKETFSVLQPPPRKQKERARRVAPRGSV